MTELGPIFTVVSFIASLINLVLGIAVMAMVYERLIRRQK